MKRLTLIRHANAEWKDAGMADLDRPLNKRGQTEAEALAQLLLDQEMVPDYLIASTARRAQQTCEILAHKLGLAPRRVKSAETLYLARAEDILSVAQATGPRIQHLALVGHNPGLSELARMLAPANTSLIDMPTGSACTLTFTARTWPGVHPPAQQAIQHQPPKFFRLSN